MSVASPHAVALFSGGLDSILAARLVQEQGLNILCLHFHSPFFGNPDRIPHWEAVYGLTIRPVNVGEAFVRLLREGPPHGTGKIMNPCVDCKILMMRRAREIMAEVGASFIVSGEVLGQRPMSQRRDTLNVIRRDGGVRDILLRPLSAAHLDPTQPELSGLVDRSRLAGISGRGRKDQLELAARMGLTEIPTPAGGCRLTEKENARRFWPVLTRRPDPGPEEFELANIGRQFWAGKRWLIVGRNDADNQALTTAAGADDILLKVRGLPGPAALARGFGDEADALRAAAAFTASYTPKAVQLGTEVEVRLSGGRGSGSVLVFPNRETSPAFVEPDFEEMREALRLRRKEAAAP